MEPSKKEIKSIQGISVLAMLCLHLFCRYNYEGLYRPIIYLFGYPLVLYLGQLSDFCVMGFAFCSGYAHYILVESDEHYYRNRLKSLMHLIVNYWIVLILFSGISILIGNSAHMPGSFEEFVGNFLIVKMTYNGAWWYLLTYIFIVLTSPILIKIIERYSIISFIILFGIYTISYIMRFDFPSENWFIRQGYLYGMTVFQYSIGVLFNKYKIFTKLKCLWDGINSRLKYVIAVVILLAILFGHTLIIPSLFIAPFTGVVIIVLYHLIYKKGCWTSFLEYIGKHSTNMWLTHMFFYLYIFENLVFVVRYPLLIYCFMIMLTIMASYIINLFQNNYRKLLYNLH